MELFRKHNVRFVSFTEVAELEMIELMGTDSAIDLVKSQIRELYNDGFELGLHLHPQWYNGRYEHGAWRLDCDEYNLCTLPQERIVEIVDRAIGYLRNLVIDKNYVPLSFRAGNWLFQPARATASVLASRGIRVDSSVFKGGLRHELGLDYRRALRNGYYWKFSERVDIPDPDGALLEIPIYTQMVPLWRMFNAKRIELERKGSSGQTSSQRYHRVRDLLRIRHPYKIDFCRLNKEELTRIVDDVILEDQWDSSTIKPIVSIGHTKELDDLETVEYLLSYLKGRGIRISTFQDVYRDCVG